MAHLGLSKDAPHVWPFIFLNDSCHGHELGAAVEPPTILVPGRCPQPIVLKVKVVRGRFDQDNIHDTQTSCR